MSAMLCQAKEQPGVQANRVRPGRDGALDALANPPDGIGGQPRLVHDIEAVDRREKRANPFLNQVGRRNAAPLIRLGHVGDQADIGQGQLRADLLITHRDRPECVNKRVETRRAARQLADSLLETGLGDRLRRLGIPPPVKSARIRFLQSTSSTSSSRSSHCQEHSGLGGIEQGVPRNLSLGQIMIRHCRQSSQEFPGKTRTKTAPQAGNSPGAIEIDRARAGSDRVSKLAAPSLDGAVHAPPRLANTLTAMSREFPPHEPERCSGITRGGPSGADRRARSNVFRRPSGR